MCDESATKGWNKENASIQQQQQKAFETAKRHEELQYLDQIRHVLTCGVTKSDRTGVGTKSVFGASSRYSLRNSNTYYFCLCST